MQFVSAPVFGRPDAALEHRVLFAVAGPKEAKEKLQPYLKWMGRGTLVDCMNSNIISLEDALVIVGLSEHAIPTFPHPCYTTQSMVHDK